MTLPRTNYPKRGLPAPPGLHVEFIPGVGEGNREAEALINATDGGTDMRVTFAPGAAPGISVDLARLLAAIQSRGTDTADAVRAVRSGVDSLLYELQHPKQTLYESPTDVAVPGGGVFVTPWIDVRLFRWIGWYLYNSGQNVTTSVGMYWSENPAGAAPYYCGNTPATAVAATGCTYSQKGTALAGAAWQPTETAPLAASYIGLYVTSAIGTTVRCKIVGMR